MTDGHSNGGSGGFFSRYGIVFWGFVAVAGYFLWTEHQAHFISALPWLLILLCPLMYLFMHHGHGGHGDHAGHSGSGDPGLRESDPRDPDRGNDL